MKTDEILKERGHSYGSFRDCVTYISRVDDLITVQAPSYEPPSLRITVTNFIKYMLALKLVRSLVTNSEEAKEDSINDFINYMRLTYREFKGVSMHFVGFELHSELKEAVIEANEGNLTKLDTLSYDNIKNLTTRNFLKH